MVYYVNELQIWYRKWEKKMKNKKITQKLLEKIAIKVAMADANATCPCIDYQPKMPKLIKKLRKF